MIRYDNHPSGRHFLQIPGPTNVPDRVLRAIDRPTINHRGPEFARLGRSILDRIGAIFQTREPVVVYAGSGTGAWEAALVNTLSPGDAVLMSETGHFALLWKRLAERLGQGVPVVLASVLFDKDKIAGLCLLRLERFQRAHDARIERP